MTETTTLDMLAAKIEKGFASADAKFTALAGDIADIRRDMATKDDIKNFATKDDVRMILREEHRDVRTDLKSIRTDLDELKEKIDNITGYRKEIDHALDRIAAIEKHLDLNNKVAA